LTILKKVETFLSAVKMQKRLSFSSVADALSNVAEDSYLIMSFSTVSILNFVEYSQRCHDTQHNDIQHTDTQHKIEHFMLSVTYAEYHLQALLH
jgi:hypothetical protein